MIATTNRMLFSLAWCTMLASTANSQSETRAERTTTKPVDARDYSQAIQWPQDRQRVVCVVAGANYTALDLIGHLETYHFPGLGKFLDDPAGRYYFENPVVARWVRQFADIIALRNEAKHQGIDDATSRIALEAALKRGFESYLEHYVRREAEQGHTDELSQDRINNLLSYFQNHFGLETEFGGWLSLLVDSPSADEDGFLRDYYHDHVEYFGGRVTASVILVRNRDPGTGALFVGDKHKAFIKRLNDIQSRLAEDGSNFEEIARLFSEDTVTAGDGGILRSIRRFDPLLPAALCREAWGLSDGKWTGPFESAFGVHFVKRLDYEHRQYIIYNDKVEPMVIETIVKQRRENLLYRVRTEQRVELRY